MSKSKKSPLLKIIISIVVVAVVVVGTLLALNYLNNSTEETGIKLNLQNSLVGGLFKKEEETKKSEIQIYQGNQRPYAVMIDNHVDAWPQANLNKAFILYEIIVEGGETRLMPVFKGQELDKIGPIRSSRHYFLDYALENDAIYVHYGWSPKAQQDISTLKVNNINGLVESSSDFWRDKTKSAPHNAITNSANIFKLAEKKKYRTTSDSKSLLNYVVDPVKLEDGEDVHKIVIPFSKQQTVTYTYDVQRGVYIRYARNKLQTDWVTGEDVYSKNIIITFAQNAKLNDGEGKDRQDLSNIGKMEGYYITNGKSIKITCEKTSRESKTVYRDLSGKEIDVNDGNTYIAIVPTDAKVTFESLAE